MSRFFFFLFFYPKKKLDKGVELVGEGLLSTGPTPSSFYINIPVHMLILEVDDLQALDLLVPALMVWPVDELEPETTTPVRPPSSRNKPTWAPFCCSQRF